MIKLKLTKKGSTALWWLYNDEKAGTRCKNYTEAKRVRRITEQMEVHAISREAGSFVACSIEIGDKDMALIKKHVEAKFKGEVGPPSNHSPGLMDILEAVEEIEEEEVQRKAAERLEAKERGEEPESEDDEDDEDE